MSTKRTMTTEDVDVDTWLRDAASRRKTGAPGNGQPLEAKGDQAGTTSPPQRQPDLGQGVRGGGLRRPDNTNALFTDWLRDARGRKQSRAPEVVADLRLPGPQA